MDDYTAFLNDEPEGPEGVAGGLSSATAPALLFIPREDVRAALAVQVANTPTTNRGCLHTSRSDESGDSPKNTEIKFDYISLTAPCDSLISLAGLVSWLTPAGTSESDWVALDRGKMGYRACLQRGHIRIYHEGTPSMGLHVVLSGEGCRQLEQEFRLFDESSWLAWFALWRSRGCRFARIDPAMDDIGPNGVLCMDVIREAVRARSYVSPFKKDKVRRVSSETWEVAENGEIVCSEGETFYFGRRSSNMFIRIYNKGAQLGESFHHIRVEPEIKGTQAEQLVSRLLAEGFSVIPRILLAYLDFKIPGSDKNISRWDTAPWWSEFLGRCEKYRFSVKEAVIRTIEDVKSWVERQAAQSMAVIFDAIEKECKKAGLNVAKAHRRFMYSLVEKGRSRYRSKHRILLGGYVPSLEGGLL